MVSIASSNGRCGGCAMRQPVRGGDVSIGRERLAVERERRQREPVAVEHQGRGRRGRIRPQAQGRAHARRGRMERYIEMDAIDQPVGRTIILKADGTGLFGAHGAGEFLRACEKSGDRSQPSKS